MSSGPIARARRLLAATATAVALVAATAGVVHGEPANATTVNPLPVFEFSGIVTDKSQLDYNPTDEFIFPSVFRAGAHLPNPLAEWYLYYAPHDAPGGIALMYSDSLTGPWTEHAANPVIPRTWSPYYSVSHVSTPEAFWHEGEQQLFLYFHGENTTTRFATSDDGITFQYGAVAVTAADGGANVIETSYARVSPHPDPTSPFTYVMFYMDNTTDNVRRIRLAESTDGRSWSVRSEPLIVPGVEEGRNVSSANLWSWEGQLYVIYHASSGKIHARSTDPSFTDLGPTLTLHESTGIGEDTGRVAAPDIISVGTETYMFLEMGDRLGGTIAYATLNPDAVRTVADPLWQSCSGAGSDEFDGAALDTSLWSTSVRGDLDRSRVEGGALVIPTGPTGVAGAPLIQQALPLGAWEATTELEFSPRAAFQQAGLLLYRDDDDYDKFDLVWGSSGLRLEHIWRSNGVDRNTSLDSTAPSSSLGQRLWLRLTSDGVSVRASVSYDGVTFSPFGRSVPVGTLAATHIGPYALRGATSAPEIEARFHWFRFTPTETERDACAGS